MAFVAIFSVRIGSALPALRREQIKTSPIGCTIAEPFKNLEFSAIVLRRICIMVFDQSGIRFSTRKIFDVAAP